MQIQSALVLALFVSSSEAFAPPRPVHTSTSLQLEILGADVSPAVIAAVGVAIVGGVGAATVSSKIREEDATTATPAATAPAPATSATASPDLSIPYDAAAKLAYEKAGGPGDYAAFKAKYEADAVAEVIAKRQPASVPATPATSKSDSTSIPYDAAAKLAYEKAGSTGDYAAFKKKYEADAIAQVVAKKQARESA